MTLQMTQEEFDKQVSERVTAALNEAVNLAANNGGNESANQLTQLVESRVNARWQEKIELMQRESAAAELARDVTAKGIPFQADVLTVELMKLAPAQSDFWGGVLKTIAANGLNDFAELGHGKRVNGSNRLPVEYEAAIREGRMTLEDLAHPIIAGELGDLNQYDLSELKGGK